MPRRRPAADGAPPPPKAPRVRKSKKEQQAAAAAAEAAAKMEAQPHYEAMNGSMCEDLYQTDYYHPAYMPPQGGPPPTQAPGGTQQPPPHLSAFGDTPQSPYVSAVGPNSGSGTPQPNSQPMMYRGVPTPQSNGPPGPPMATGPPPPQQMPQPQVHPNGPPAPSPLEFRIHDMNRRLYIFSTSGIAEKDIPQWWDAFTYEFFDDDASIHILIQQPPHPAHHEGGAPVENGNNPPQQEHYWISRQLIPRFFRSMFESGVRELYYVVRSQSSENMLPNHYISFEVDNFLTVLKMDRPVAAEVHTESDLFIEFAPYDEMFNFRAHSWTVRVRSTQEMLVNELAKTDPTQERIIQQTTGLTYYGLPLGTHNFLKIGSILQPMQELMCLSKNNQLPPRETMRYALFHCHNKMQQQHQQQQHNQMAAAMNSMGGPPPGMMPPVVEEPATKAKAPRKRTRKPPATTNAKNKKATASPAPTNAAFPNPVMHPGGFSQMGFHQEVMVVGEPSMMGGDYGEEDERTISRVENAQYDPAALQLQQQQQAAAAAAHGQPPSGQPNLVQLGPPTSNPLPPQYGMPPEYGDPVGWGAGGPPLHSN